MENKKIILYLIKQDMIHAQLIGGIKRLGFETDLYTVSMLEVILPLMGIETPPCKEWPEISDELSDLYNCFMDKAEEYPVTVTGSELMGLAEECYERIQKYVKSYDELKA